MRRTVKSMVDDAMSAITTYSVEEAQQLHGRDDVQFVDIRDVRELEREGIIPGAFHAPRGMLEFWVDPESPYHKPLFAQIVDELIEFVRGAEIIIHNAAFDIGFLDMELRRMGRPPLLEHGVRVTDTLSMARDSFPGKSNSYYRLTGASRPARPEPVG